jgi:hypothetical protein
VTPPPSSGVVSQSAVRGDGGDAGVLWGDNPSAPILSALSCQIADAQLETYLLHRRVALTRCRPVQQVSLGAHELSC